MLGHIRSHDWIHESWLKKVLSQHEKGVRMAMDQIGVVGHTSTFGLPLVS